MFQLYTEGFSVNTPKMKIHVHVLGTEKLSQEIPLWLSDIAEFLCQAEVHKSNNKICKMEKGNGNNFLLG